MATQVTPRKEQAQPGTPSGGPLARLEHPFMLSVAMLGGGGYFLMTATPQGVSVEASLDFGANISVNLGVASGNVSAVAGLKVTLYMFPPLDTTAQLVKLVFEFTVARLGL